MSSPSTNEQTIVVGGGIVGAMCAWFLRQTGREVTIVERDEFGRGCSHGNCGYISPSHILPLTTPGAVRRALASMIRPDSPFYVRPRWSLELWRWMWNFSRRCNPRDMLEAARGLHPLLESSRQLYRQLITAHRLQCEWREQGLLFVYQDAHEFEAFEATNRLLRDEFGVTARPVDAAELARMEPALKPGLGGAWLYDCDSHLRPDRLLAELRRLLVAHGVTIREHAELQSLVREGRRVRGVVTSGGRWNADQVIIATGAWTPFLNRELGCRIPIQPGKGYSITMPRPALCPRYPMIFEQHRVAITPFDSCFRIGSTMEFGGYDRSINPRRVAILTRGAELYLQQPGAEPILETWYGWRPMTWDSKPLIDRAPIADNVWLAVGHNMLGLSTATGTGRLIADLIDGRTPHIDPAPYRLARLGI